ncbi:MAG: PaaI family thioesterase [Geminicoccaceae bacterium]
MTSARISLSELEELAWEGVPLVGRLDCSIEKLERGHVVVRLPYRDELLRPGGTICGPAMFALADIALYAAVLSEIGPVPLAVTTDMTMHFLSRPAPGDLLASGELLKIGKRLAIGEVTLRAVKHEEIVSHAVGTYAIPPR